MRRSLLTALIIAAIGLVALALLWRRSLILALVFLILSLAFYLLDRRRGDASLYAWAVLIGLIVELVGTASGAWRVGRADVRGIAFWLPLGYGLAALVFHRIAAFIKG